MGTGARADLTDEEILAGRRFGLAPDVLEAVRDPKDEKKLAAGKAALKRGGVKFAPKSVQKIQAVREVDDWESDGGKNDWQEGPSSLRAKNAYDLMGMISEAKKNYTIPIVPEAVQDFAAKGVDRFTLGNMQYNPRWKEQVKFSEERSPVASTLGGLAGDAAITGASAYAPGGPILKSVIQGLATKPEGDEISGRLAGGGLGFALPVAVNKLSGGARTAGDWLQQKAVGLKNYVAGTGEEIVNSGLINPFMGKGWTREGMKDRIGKGATETWNKIEGVANRNPNLISPDDIADRVSSVGKERVISLGAIDDPADLELLQAVQDAEKRIRGRGSETASTMLERRRAAYARAKDAAFDPGKKNAQMPANARISKAEGLGYSEKLHGEMPELAPLDKRYGALSAAEGALRAKTPIYQGGGAGLAALGAGIGASAMGAPTLGAPIAAYLATRPGVQSAAAHAMVRGGQVAPYMTPAMLAELLNARYGGGE